VNGSGRVTIIGAGALGLGFLGPSFSEEAEILFLDVEARQSLIEGLEKRRFYGITLAGPSPRRVEVKNVRAMLTRSPEAAPALSESDLCFTAVGAGNLPSLSALFRDAGRLRGGKGPLRVLAAENGYAMGRRIEQLAGPEANIKATDTVMGRMCRFTDEPGSAVLAEEFYGIPFLKSTGFPDLPFSALQPCDEKRFALEKDVKLFAHNCVHGMFAHAAARQGLSRICEAGAQEPLRERARAMLKGELLPALKTRHNGVLDSQAYLNYAVHLVERILSPWFADTVERGIRGAPDKLLPSERWVSAVRFVRGAGLKASAYLAAFSDVLAVSGLLCNKTLKEVLTDHCGFSRAEASELEPEIQGGIQWIGKKP